MSLRSVRSQAAELYDAATQTFTALSSVMTVGREGRRGHVFAKWQSAHYRWRSECQKRHGSVGLGGTL